MDLTGKISSLSRDYRTKKPVITLEVEEEPAGIESLQGEALSIKIVKKRERRSLDSNAYFHVLADKLRQRLRLSMARMKNILIGSYGQAEYIGGQITTIETNIPPEWMLEQESLHTTYLGPVVENVEEGTTLHRYRVNRGSHTYDTREMALLIDGTIEECKAQGIETATPDQLAEMAALWDRRRG